MLLMDAVFRLVPEQTKTNVVLEIAAPQDFDRLVIRAAYAPKRVTDAALVERVTNDAMRRFDAFPPGVAHVPYESCPPLLNFVTFSLDINGRFCGYAHRHNEQQVIEVAAHTASPGFHAMRPERGIWRVTLAVCYVGSPVCEYRLCVYGLKEGEAL